MYFFMQLKFMSSSLEKAATQTKTEKYQPLNPVAVQNRRTENFVDRANNSTTKYSPPDNAIYASCVDAFLYFPKKKCRKILKPSKSSI